MRGTPSPPPERVFPVAFEGTVATPTGNVRGAYSGVKLGNLTFDNGPNPVEEIATGEVRRWVYQASGGSLVVGQASFPATCVRVRRINVLTPSQEFYYEFRVSAQEGSCGEDEDERPVEFVLTMDDFVVNRFRTGKLRYFGQTPTLLLYPTVLRAPERVQAVAVEGGLSVGGNLGKTPPAANLALELMLRPNGQASCHKTKFNPAIDPYASHLVLPDRNGKWGAIVPRTGGALCMRLVGGGWESAVSPVQLP